MKFHSKSLSFKILFTVFFAFIFVGCQHLGFEEEPPFVEKGGIVFRILPPKNIPNQTFTLQLKHLGTGKKFSLKQNPHHVKSKDKLWSLPVGKYKFMSLNFVQKKKNQQWAPKKHPTIYIKNNKISNLGLYKFGSAGKKLIVLHQIPENFYQVPKKQHVTDIDVINAFTKKTQITLKAPKKIQTPIAKKKKATTQPRTKTSLSQKFEKDHETTIFKTKSAPMIDTFQGRPSTKRTPYHEKGDMNYSYKRSVMFKYSVNLGKHTPRYGKSMVSALERNHSKLQQCYKDRLDAGMPIRGNMRMNFEYDGRIREVQSLKSRKNDLVDGKLSRCLSTTLEKMNFNINRPMRGLVNFKLNYVAH